MAKKRKQVTCVDCGETREVRADKHPLRCPSCRSKHHYTPPTLTERVCATKGCGRNLKSINKTGFCYICWNSNADGVKTRLMAQYNQRPSAKLRGFARRGAEITEEDFADFSEKTHCELCEKPFGSGKKNLDHCHSTGKYRGALCLQCNTALGKLGDDLNLIIERLTRYRDK